MYVSYIWFIPEKKKKTHFESTIIAEISNDNLEDTLCTHKGLHIYS